jgi:replicative DNA helicase
VVRFVRTLAAMTDDVRLAEQVLVAGLVLEPDRLPEVSGIVSRADFSSPVCGLLFGRLTEGALDGPGGGLPDALRQRGELRVDGYPLHRLVQWFDLVPPVASLSTYARLVVEGAACRRVQQAGVRLVQLAQRGQDPGRCLRGVAVQRSVLLAERRRLEPERPRRVDGSARAPGSVRRTLRARVGSDVVHAELVTVGAVVLAPALVHRLGWLSPADFAAADCGRVFSRVVSMVRDGVPVDRVTVRDQLRRHQELPEARAGALLEAAESAVPVVASAPFYASQVLGASISRQVGAAGEQLRQLATHRRGDAVEVIDAAVSVLDSMGGLRDRLARARGSQPARPVVRAAEQVVRPQLYPASRGR